MYLPSWGPLSKKHAFGIRRGSHFKSMLPSPRWDPWESMLRFAPGPEPYLSFGCKICAGPLADAKQRVFGPRVVSIKMRKTMVLEGPRQAIDTAESSVD
jgi:hypothetical protein